MGLYLNIFAGRVDIPAGENVFLVILVVFVNFLHNATRFHVFLSIFFCILRICDTFLVCCVCLFCFHCFSHFTGDLLEGCGF